MFHDNNRKNKQRFVHVMNNEGRQEAGDLPMACEERLVAWGRRDHVIDVSTLKFCKASVTQVCRSARSQPLVPSSVGPLNSTLSSLPFTLPPCALSRSSHGRSHCFTKNLRRQLLRSCCYWIMNSLICQPCYV